MTEKIPYYTVIKGVGYWRPPGWARAKPYEMEGCTCGPDGPEAREIARGRVQLMRRMRVTGEVAQVAPTWPQGSLGHFYERWTRSKAFTAKKSTGTREEFEQAWAHVSKDLKAKALGKIRPSDIEKLQFHLEATASDWTRWRTIKKLREVFSAAVRYQFITSSPAVTMANPTPQPRNQVWLAAEVALMVEKADELGKPDMALAIQLLWDTLMSPVDVRTLSRAMVDEDQVGCYIHRKRSKVKTADVWVDLPPATCRRLKAYMKGTPTTVGDTPIIRGERGGKAFANRHEFARRFDTIREAVFGADEKRQMRDIRRSGSVAAQLGGATADERGAILANSMGSNARLEVTYTPPTLAAARAVRRQREAGDAILAAVAVKRGIGS